MLFRSAPVSVRVPSRWWYWIALAATGTTLLMAVTNQITQDIAVSPFLWVLPLSVYLLSFILTFESDRWYRRTSVALLGGILAALACGVYAADVGIALWTQVGAYLLALLAACLLCHGELYRSRPTEDNLTAFYVCVTAGGLIGGAFTAILAPRQIGRAHV